MRSVAVTLTLRELQPPVQLVCAAGCRPTAPHVELRECLGLLVEYLCQRDSPFPTNPWARYALQPLQALLQRPDFLEHCTRLDTHDELALGQTEQGVRRLVACAPGLCLPVLDGAWRTDVWDHLSDLLAALATATDNCRNWHAQQEVALTCWSGLEVEQLEADDPFTQGMLHLQHPYSQVLQAVQAILASRLLPAEPAAGGPQPAKRQKRAAPEEAEEAAGEEVQSFLVPASLRQLVDQGRHTILVLLAKQLPPRESAELKGFVKEVYESSRWMPKPRGAQLPTTTYEALVQSRRFYQALYVACLTLQAASLACSVESLSAFRKKKVLMSVVAPLRKLHNRVLGCGADLVARQRLLCVLYGFARVWQETGEVSMSVPMRELCGAALEALPVALAPVLKARDTSGRGAARLQRDPVSKERGLAMLPLALRLAKAQDKVLRFRAGAGATVRVEPHKLSLLHHASRDHYYLPVSYADSRRDNLQDSQQVVAEAQHALRALSELRCVEAASERLLAVVPASLGAPEARQPGKHSRLAVVPTSFATAADACTSGAYLAGLRYALEGQPLDTKWALPGQWREKTYKPASLCCFAAYPAQFVRSAAEQREAEELVQGSACECFVTDTTCTKWLERWWDERGSDEFRLLVDARASWTGLACVDARDCTEEGKAQLFAMSVYLGTRAGEPAAGEPAAAEGAEQAEEDEVQLVEPGAARGLDEE